MLLLMSDTLLGFTFNLTTLQWMRISFSACKRLPRHGNIFYIFREANLILPCARGLSSAGYGNQGRGPSIISILPTDRNLPHHKGSDTFILAPICRISPSEWARMLGVYLNPKGELGTHLKERQKKADSFATAITCGHTQLHAVMMTSIVQKTSRPT
jgi:hypothetical protein